MLSFKLTFSLFSFTFIKRLFSSSSLSTVRVVSSAYPRLLIFLPAILIPAFASSRPAFCLMSSAYKLNDQVTVYSFDLFLSQLGTNLLFHVKFYLSHLLTPTTRTLPPCRQHCSTPPIIKILLMSLGFPGGSEVKASACNAGDLGSIPGLGRSPGEGNGNPLQYSCLENPIDREACWATIHGVAKSQTPLCGFTSLNAPNRTR